MHRIRRWAVQALDSRHAYRLLLLLFYTSIIAAIVLQVELRAQANCLSHWADRLTTRTEQLTTQNTAALAARQRRDDQLAHLITNAIGGHKASKADLDAYVNAAADAAKAQAMYQQALLSNPVPPAPKFSC